MLSVTKRKYATEARAQLLGVSLHFQKKHVLFPASAVSSQPSVTPAPRDLPLSSGLHGYLHMSDTYTEEHTQKYKLICVLKKYR